jgi:DNA-binding response OmpR family regulator
MEIAVPCAGLPDPGARMDLANAENPSREQKTKRSPRVVVAEDQPEMRALIANMLRREGYCVNEAKDGSTLLDLLIETLDDKINPQIPALIVTDIWMPGCSGLEVLSRLRRFSWSTRVIVITAFGDETAHVEARRLGAALVLDKPFDLATLRAAARDLAPIR